jgi:hypothetical protein
MADYGVLPSTIILLAWVGLLTRFVARRFGRPREIDLPPKSVRASPDTDLPDLNWMFPPNTIEDPKAWDRYWLNQLSSGMAALVDMFCADGTLIDVMRASGFKTVLCVGNGVSAEPHALARAGFDVTALDLSPLAIEAIANAKPDDELLSRLAEGRATAPGGHLQFIAGGLLDAACCPGPYDVIIERRTLQLFPEESRAAAMEAVANRLGPKGIFFSHCHDGRWKPPAQPKHFTHAWFVSQGWAFQRDDAPVTRRVAWLFTSTG